MHYAPNVFTTSIQEQPLVKHETNRATSPYLFQEFSKGVAQKTERWQKQVAPGTAGSHGYIADVNTSTQCDLPDWPNLVLFLRIQGLKSTKGDLWWALPGEQQEKSSHIVSHHTLYPKKWWSSWIIKINAHGILMIVMMPYIFDLKRGSLTSCDI